MENSTSRRSQSRGKIREYIKRGIIFSSGWRSIIKTGAKILLVTQLFPPEIGAAPTRMLEFTRGLRNRGFDITVLTALPNYPTGAIFENFRGKTENWDAEEKILRTNIRPFKQKSSFLRLVTYFSYLNSSRAGDRHHFPKGSFDIVIASSPPIFVGVAGCDIADRHGARLVFDVRDIWPDIAVNMGLIKEGSLPQRWLESINRRILKRSSKVLVTTCTDQMLIAQRGFPEEDIVKIPNGASLKVFNLLPDDTVQSQREKLGINGKFVICYSGSFNQGMNDVHAFVPLMDKLKDIEDVVLVLIGDGENLEEIRETVARHKLQNIIFLPHQELSELNISLNATDLGLIPRKRLVNGLSGGLPVKMFECWALSKPVLLAAGSGSEERKLLESVGGGIAVDPENIDDMASAITRLKNDRELSKSAGEKGRQAVIENFSREAALDKLVETLNTMTD